MKQFFKIIWFYIKIVIACVLLPPTAAAVSVLILAIYLLGLVISIVMAIVRDSVKYWSATAEAVEKAYWKLVLALTNPNKV